MQSNEAKEKREREKRRIREENRRHRAAIAETNRLAEERKQALKKALSRPRMDDCPIPTKVSTKVNL